MTLINLRAVSIGVDRPDQRARRHHQRWSGSRSRDSEYTRDPRACTSTHERPRRRQRPLSAYGVAHCPRDRRRRPGPIAIVAASRAERRSAAKPRPARVSFGFRDRKSRDGIAGRCTAGPSAARHPQQRCGRRDPGPARSTDEATAAVECFFENRESRRPTGTHGIFISLDPTRTPFGKKRTLLVHALEYPSRL